MPDKLKHLRPNPAVLRSDTSADSLYPGHLRHTLGNGYNPAWHPLQKDGPSYVGAMFFINGIVPDAT